MRRFTTTITAATLRRGLLPLLAALLAVPGMVLLLKVAPWNPEHEAPKP